MEEKKGRMGAPPPKFPNKIRENRRKLGEKKEKGKREKEGRGENKGSEAHVVACH
jgi:hypothetical protein